MPSETKTLLSAEEARSILDYNPETGIFRWRYNPAHSKQWNTRYPGKIAGYSHRGYISIQIGKGKNLRANRLAWLYMTGEWPDHIVDHKNGVREDNRWDNLRKATFSQNNCNCAMKSNNKSGYVGVHFVAQRNRWRARVSINNVVHDLGFFKTAEEANSVRSEHVKKIQGDFVPLNSRDRPKYPHYRDQFRS